MTNSPHTLETNWRENDASAMEARVEALNHWLEHTEDVIEMLENDEEVRVKLLGLAGLIRSRRNDLTSAAGKLRAEAISK